MASCFIRLLNKIPVIVISLLAIYAVLEWKRTYETQDVNTNLHVDQKKTTAIHVGVVVCKGENNRVFFEALTMMKSATIFTRAPLHFHVFTETLKPEFELELSKWPEKAMKKIVVTIHPLQYPLSDEDLREFKNWWGPCASYRLFLPEVLSNVDSLIYVDTDVLFLGPVDDVWDHFSRFNKYQVGALAPRVGWDFNVPEDNKNFISMPNGRNTQVNSGVFLMNLTRMREKRFVSDPQISTKATSWNKEFLLPLYHSNKQDMYGDQNLINIIFHFNPRLLYFLPCKYNYHHKFCFDKREDRKCSSAEMEGAAVIHGSANTFYNNYSPAFAAINNAVKEYNFEENLDLYLLQPLLLNLRKTTVELHEHCGGKTKLFSRHLQKHVYRQNTFPASDP